MACSSRTSVSSLRHVWEIWYFFLLRQFWIRMVASSPSSSVMSSQCSAMSALQAWAYGMFRLMFVALSYWKLLSSYLQDSLTLLPSLFPTFSSFTCSWRHLASLPLPGVTSEQNTSMSTVQFCVVLTSPSPLARSASGATSTMCETTSLSASSRNSCCSMASARSPAKSPESFCGDTYPSPDPPSS